MRYPPEGQGGQGEESREEEDNEHQGGDQSSHHAHMESVHRLGHLPEHEEAHNGHQQRGDGGDLIVVDLEGLLEEQDKDDNE